MADPISTAIALAKFVPDIVGWIGGKEKKAAAQELVKIAEGVTGKNGDKVLEAIEADPKLALQYKEAVMADKHKLDEMFLADRQGARDMNVTSQKMAELSDRTADSIMVWNLPAVAALIIIQCLVILFLEDKAELVALVSNAIGFVIASLLNERQAVVGFLFGSSMGSKLKNLSKK